MSRSTHAPEDLLAAAQHLLDTPDGRTVGVWARAVAYLSRQALERSLDELWYKKAPGTERFSRRAQLICLPCFLGNDELAKRITYTWNGLSHETPRRDKTRPATKPAKLEKSLAMAYDFTYPWAIRRDEQGTGDQGLTSQRRAESTRATLFSSQTLPTT